MRYASVTDRLSGLAGAKWALHARARAMQAAGEQIIELTIGEPDVPTPTRFIEAATRSMSAGRTGYSNGRGEPGVVAALAARYTARRGREITRDQIMCLPGTQTVLYAVLRALVEAASSLIDGAEGGTHHLSGNPDTSWADFARKIMRQAALPCRIDDIPTSAYPTPARRPLNSRLECSLFDATFGISRPDWRAGLSDILKELTQ